MISPPSKLFASYCNCFLEDRKFRINNMFLGASWCCLYIERVACIVKDRKCVSIYIYNMLILKVEIPGEPYNGFTTASNLSCSAFRDFFLHHLNQI